MSRRKWLGLGLLVAVVGGAFAFVAPWIAVGLVVAVGGGALVVPPTLDRIRKDIPGRGLWSQGDIGPSTQVIGLTERAFFALAIGFNLSGVISGMMLWVGAKMAANWTTRTGRSPSIQTMRITALVGSLVSLLFALIGGLIIQYGLPS